MRICITGIGIVSPLGNAKTAFRAIQQKKSGIKKLQLLENMSCQIGGAVDIQSKTPKYIEMALKSAQDAIFDAHLHDYDNKRFGVSCGSGFGDLTQIQQNITRFNDSLKLSPFTVPNMLINMAAGRVAITHNLQGPLLAPATACAASLHAVIDGYKCIRDGDADIMLVGGTEASLTRFGVESFARAKAVTVKNNDSPELGSQPFSPNRSGFVLSEGAGFIVLESEPHAKSRNAAIYAYIDSYGMSCDAHHITTPGNQGAYRCMKMALTRASHPNIDLVNCHATSTPVGDDVELEAIEQLCPNAKRVAYKQYAGHLLGAAGVFELAMGVQESFNYQLKNSFGFGGVNASVVLSKK